MTDWNAQHSTVQAANTGLDMTMPGSDFNGGTVLWGPELTKAVNNGQVAQSRVDDMVKRILAAWYVVGQDTGYPPINIQANVQGDHKTNVRAVARDGIVLLKNTGSILPLKKPTKLALVGSAAVVNPSGANACTDRGCNTNSLGMGWGSGTSEYPYFSAPYDALKTRTSADGTTLTLSSSDSTGNVASTVSGADAAIVVITSDSGEGYITVEGNAGDRNNLDPWVRLIFATLPLHSQHPWPLNNPILDPQRWYLHESNCFGVYLSRGPNFARSCPSTKSLDNSSVSNHIRKESVLADKVHSITAMPSSRQWQQPTRIPSLWSRVLAQLSLKIFWHLMV